MFPTNHLLLLGHFHINLQLDVVADHGFAGAAAQAGLDTVGYADCNDPALFIGEALGRVRVAVPLDDNVAPHLYAPLTAYLLAGLLTDR